jgi:hypothetical protein
MANRLFVSFSGGETSAYMAALIHMVWRGQWGDVVTAFANTGQENEETLEFVQQCERRFGFQTVWVERNAAGSVRKGDAHRIVDISTASRNGEPFEAVIQKYGIPNQDWPHCTRELKLVPMKSYLRSIGWEPGTYDTALGIRADEARRRSKSAKENRIIYPLMDMRPTTKPEVNEFWMSQPFRLNLMGYEGNCKTCWKKSLRKLLTIMDDNPRKFDWNEQMEAKYGTVGAEYRKDTPAKNERRVFFRGHMSTKDLREVHAHAKFMGTLERAEDDAIQVPSTGELFQLDAEPSDGACTESCEVNFEEVV